MTVSRISSTWRCARAMTRFCPKRRFTLPIQKGSAACGIGWRWRAIWGAALAPAAPIRRWNPQGWVAPSSTAPESGRFDAAFDMLTERRASRRVTRSDALGAMMRSVLRPERAARNGAWRLAGCVGRLGSDRNPCHRPVGGKPGLMPCNHLPSGSVLGLSWPCCWHRSGWFTPQRPRGVSRSLRVFCAGGAGYLRG